MYHITYKKINIYKYTVLYVAKVCIYTCKENLMHHIFIMQNLKKRKKWLYQAILLNLVRSQ